jgi:hypothetical protein
MVHLWGGRRLKTYTNTFLFIKGAFFGFSKLQSQFYSRHYQGTNLESFPKSGDFSIYLLLVAVASAT